MLKRRVEPFTRSVGRLVGPARTYSWRQRGVKSVAVVPLRPIWGVLRVPMRVSAVGDLSEIKEGLPVRQSGADLKPPHQAEGDCGNLPSSAKRSRDRQHPGPPLPGHLQIRALQSGRPRACASIEIFW